MLKKKKKIKPKIVLKPHYIMLVIGNFLNGKAKNRNQNSLKDQILFLRCIALIYNI